MKNRIYLFVTCCLTLAFVFFQSCNNENDITKIDETSRVQIKLVDEPGDYQEVNIEIVDIQYKSSDDEEENDWMSFTPESGYPLNVDLTELVAGNYVMLVDEVIPASILKQVRLVLSDNNTLLIEGEEEYIHLDTPSAQQSGLKLNLDTELEAGYSYSFILDWVVQESIVKAGNSGRYILKPVINVIAEVNSGSIGGSVFETIESEQVSMENVTIQVFNQNDEFVTDTLTNTDGVFLVQGLEAGSYKIKINQEGYQEYLSDEIIVNAGETYDIGTIELISE